MVDISRLNPDDPQTLGRILERLAALERQVRALPDLIPNERGLAQTTRQGYMSKEQVVALNTATANIAANTAKLATYPDTRGHVEAYQSANVARASGTTYDFVTDNEIRDVNGEWNGATATFTSSRAGVFLVVAQVLIITPPDQSRLYMQLTDTSNVEFLRGDDQTQSGTAGDLRGSIVAPVYFGAAGGQFKVRFQTSNGAASSQNSRGGAAFMWLKIRELA